MPILLYGLEACTVNKSQLSSLEFIINRFLMKLYEADFLCRHDYAAGAPTLRVTLGDRAFPVAAARTWNSLPAQIRAASSLMSFSAADKGPSVSDVVQLTSDYSTIVF